MATGIRARGLIIVSTLALATGCKTTKPEPNIVVHIRDAETKAPLSGATAKVTDIAGDLVLDIPAETTALVHDVLLDRHGVGPPECPMGAELAASRGEDWYGLGDGALHRLVAISESGLVDPEVFDRLVGVRQERPPNARAGWLQLYQRRFPQRLAAPFPNVADGHRWLGGNALVLLSALSKK